MDTGGFALFVQINQDPLVMEYMPNCLNTSETEAFFQRIQTHFQKHGFGLLACEIKNTSEFIGYVGLNIPAFEAHFTPCVEIGWRLRFQSWGYGYATEAAKAILKTAFENIGLKEVVSFTVPQNVRSRRVMEKIGMKHDSKEDFNHPIYTHLKHVLYRITNHNKD